MTVRALNAASLALACLMAVACMRTVMVHSKCGEGACEKPEGESGEREARKLEGVPFYVKVQSYEQKTAYEQVWYETTLIVLQQRSVAKDGPPIEVEVQRLVQAFNEKGRGALRDIEKAILDATDAAGVSNLVGRFSTLAGNRGFTDIQPDPDAPPVSNVLEPVTVVDYDNPHYINSHMPWFGSATLASTLAADGTLTTVSATADTKLAEAIAGFLPLKEFLSSKYVKTDTPKAQDPNTQGMIMSIGAVVGLPMRATLSIEKKGYLYTFSRTTKADPCKDGVPCPTPLPFDLDHGEFVRTALGGEQPVKEDPGKVISVEGTIGLPKDP